MLLLRRLMNVVDTSLLPVLGVSEWPGAPVELQGGELPTVLLLLHHYYYLL